jgi:hypothetical protein
MPTEIGKKPSWEKAREVNIGDFVMTPYQDCLGQIIEKLERGDVYRIEWYTHGGNNFSKFSWNTAVNYRHCYEDWLRVNESSIQNW